MSFSHINRNVKKAIISLKVTADTKKRKILCRHPVSERRLIHVKESNTSLEICGVCGKKLARVSFSKKRKE